MPLFQTARQLLAMAGAAGAGLAATPAAAAGPDLLVAPTRVVLEGQRGAEVILNNTGDAPATYRISLELKRMTADGRLDPVEEADADPRERQTLDMISYAPRRVTLAPGQPQAIRIGVRAPAGLADGEYRAHMLFRGVPEVAPVTDAAPDANGVAIQLTPVYGISIPIIVRQGQLASTATIGAVSPVVEDGQPGVAVHLTRAGERSIYGQLRLRAGRGDEAVALVNGVAIYTELTDRDFTLPLDPAAAALHGPVTVEYLENRDGAMSLVASRTVTLP